MSVFYPDGYLPTREAIVRAAERWFPDKFAALQKVTASESQAKPDDSLDAAVRVFSQTLVPDASRHAFEEIVSQTVQRLRSSLHQGILTAYYFTSDGCQRTSREFWATADADGVIETSTFWPFGRPARIYETRPNYTLFLLQSELHALLSEQLVKKRPFPQSKMPALVTAMRTLEHLNRGKQREALRSLPEFEKYHLTDDVLRQAQKQVPRKAGRKPLRPER